MKRIEKILKELAAMTRHIDEKKNKEKKKDWKRIKKKRDWQGKMMKWLQKKKRYKG